MKNKIFIIIPVFNRIEYTKKCLASIEKQTYKNYEVIIVDDGSTDGTYEFIKDKYPFWKIIRGNGNWWWTKSMFLGIEYSLNYSKEQDYILSLNNDCYAKSDYLKNIVSAAESNNRSIVGSMVVDADNPKKIIEAGIKIDWPNNSIYPAALNTKELSEITKDEEFVRNIDTLPGKGTLFPIETIGRSGNFNYKRLPHYISDYEFFIRAKRNGFNLIVSTKSKLYNFSKATGTTHLTGFKSSYKKVFTALFGRKSKLNIIDYLNFVLLSCPREYLYINLKHVLARFTHYLLNISPFCYFGLVIQQIKILVHNIPIILTQLNKQNIGKHTCKVCNGITYLKYKSLYDDRHGYPKKYDIYKCFNCSFMQTQPQLTMLDLSKIYTKYYPKRDANISEILTNSNNIPSKKTIIKNGWETTCHYRTKRDQKVLDVGCGTCQSLLEIKKMGGKAWGIDPDKNSLNVAKKLKLNFHSGTIHDCPFTKESFDLITASQVLEHEPDPIQFLNTCKQFIKPNGKIILSFPNTSSLSNLILKRRWVHWHIPYHLNHLNKKSFTKLIEKSDLHIDEIKTVTPNLWTILQIKSLLSEHKIGIRNTFWDNGSTKKSNKQNQNILNEIIVSVLPLIEKNFVINRFIDYLGLGDSLVVTLKN